jgi:hypothetical protein
VRRSFATLKPLVLNVVRSMAGEGIEKRRSTELCVRK